MYLISDFTDLEFYLYFKSNFQSYSSFILTFILSFNV